MKRVMLIVLLLVLVCSAAVAESYTPQLGMTIQEFIGQYNSVSSPLTSPLKAMSKPILWTDMDEYVVAWLYPDPNSKVTVFLCSMDKEKGESNDAGLDMIQIGMEKEADFLSFITIVARCSEVFGESVFGVKLTSQMIVECMKGYYENDCAAQGMMWGGDISSTDPSVKLAFFKDANWHYFQIYK